MNHLNIRQINYLLDNSYSDKNVTELLSHISDCAACTKEYKKYKNVHQGLQKITLLNAPLNFNEMVLSKIYRSSIVIKRNKRFIGFMAAGFGMLMVITITILLYILLNTRLDGITTEFSNKTLQSFTHLLNACSNFTSSYMPHTIIIATEIIIVSGIVTILEQFRKLHRKH